MYAHTVREEAYFAGRPCSPYQSGTDTVKCLGHSAYANAVGYDSHYFLILMTYGIAFVSPLDSAISQSVPVTSFSKSKRNAKRTMYPCHIRRSINKQEAQLMLTNLCDAFGGQSRSANVVPFHMLGIVSYCAIVTLSLRRAVFMIFDFKNVVTSKWGQRSLKVIESDIIR